MTAHVTQHEQNFPASSGSWLRWWAPRLLLVSMGALLGAELGVWVSEPGELDRLAHSLGVASRHARAPAATAVAADVPVAGAGVAASAPGQDDGWHVAAPRAAIPSVDVSVLPRAGEMATARPSHAARASHPGVTRRARAHAPADDDLGPPIDQAALSTALSDAL